MNYKNIKLFPSNKHFYLTKTGLDGLRVRLNHLSSERRKICKRLMGMEHREREEYIISTNIINILEIMEAEVTKISNILRRAVIVSNNKKHSNIKLGSTVSLRSGKETIEYTLVNSIEADPSSNRISEESPLGKALIGKKEHSIVHLSTPTGKESRYRIMGVS